jgi:glutathione synthase/RimK-type ligase-like ATP-grasp enzyme
MAVKLGGNTMSRSTRIALVTARPRPEVHFDHDMALLKNAVAMRGADVSVTYWDDSSVDWASFDLVVIRSPWDYSWRAREFLEWLSECSGRTRIMNQPSIMQWNADKTYLRYLQDQSIPIISTQFFAPGEAAAFPSDYEYVVKPSIGAGSRYCARYMPDERQRAEEHVQRIHAEGVTAMVQPYVHQIDTSGERALVFIEGKFLHAIRKNAVLSPGLRFDVDKDAHPGTRSWTPTDQELELARKVLAAIPFSESLLYARVDMVSDATEPVLTELELIEPGLYLRTHPGSEDRVAMAIVSAASVVSC